MNPSEKTLKQARVALLVTRRIFAQRSKQRRNGEVHMTEADLAAAILAGIQLYEEGL